MTQVVAAFDKFRGTLTAAEACDAACRAAARLGLSCVARPLADGGEGTLEALGGANRQNCVIGPLGEPVDAAWRLEGRRAVIEMSRASGLLLAGGAGGNDPMAATTRGTGQLLRVALDAGAQSIVVGVGGSATTDGGLGAFEAVGAIPPDVEVVVACDVRTLFVDAAAQFGPQKGADPHQVVALTSRLAALVLRYREQYGIDVADLEGSGAAGGLAGGLAALGATLRPGFLVVAEHVGLAETLRGASIVLTGEGRVDESSWRGKVVGGVKDMATAPVHIIAGCVDRPRRGVFSLQERYGLRSTTDAAAVLEEEVYRILSTRTVDMTP